MNTIIFKKKKSEPYIPEQGDIFKDNKQELYLLCFIYPNWASIALNDGNHWNGLHKEVNDAISELTFYKRNAKITIE